MAAPKISAAVARPRVGWAGELVRVGGLFLVVFLVALATRAPLVGEYLANWDAVQYALGLVDFDVTRHQPHPPGSILYVGAARALLALTGDAQVALAAISVVAGSAAVALCYVTGRMVFGPRVAAAGTLLYAVSPLTWYYGAVALPYALEGALTLGAVALLWRAAEEERVGAAVGAAGLLALAGGIRQTTILLLLPLWVYATWRACGLPPPLSVWRGRREWRRLWRRGRGLIGGLALLGALCLAWAVPLMVLSGGPVAYLTASRRLSSLVSSLTSVFVIGLPAIGLNVAYLVDVAAMGLNLALVPFALLLVRGTPWPWRPSPEQGWFLRLWVGPALVVYSLVHIGQAGYLLLLWPLVCLAAGTAALVVGGAVGRRWPRLGRRAVPLLLGMLACWSAAVFMWTPLFGPGGGGLTRKAIQENDRTWRALSGLAGRYAPGELAILTGTRAQESFRQATYYLPEIPVYAVGLDRQGQLGVAFRGYAGEHTYADFMAGAPAARRTPLPPGTKRLLILDESVARLYPPGALEEVAVTPTRLAWLWPAAPDGRDLVALAVRAPLGEDADPPQLPLESR